MSQRDVVLDEEQAVELHRLAAEQGIEVADLVKEAVARWLRETHGVSYEERKRRALAALGRFSSGLHDISGEHDRYLEEAYRS